MNKINNFLRRNIITIFTIYLFIQPVLDIATSVALYKFNVDFTVSSLIRVVFLLFTLYYLIFVERKKINIKMLILIMLYSIIFMLCNILFNKLFISYVILGLSLNNTLQSINIIE